MEEFYMDPTRYHGRPASAANRTEQELACYDLLDRLAVVFARADHGHADTIEQCKRVEGVLGAPICKNLFLCNRQKTQFYLLMLAGDKVFKTKDLSKQLGVARLSFAGPEEMREYLDVTPGSVTVLALKNDRDHRVQLVIDQSVAAGAQVSCHPCINTSTILLSTRDLMDKVLPALEHEPVLVDLPWNA
ncbi:MAG: prolyl-tRNA synthetase associated domain-containing protein [Oscillospiraceae bacterium]|nr:prolyl-tRNA synthetase associated domain-containing protein [Oscillospiraceae bacterium]